ncbi:MULTISPECIES: hypothetical protein [unclassified Sphingomonas]|uniref:hypothetical protein n=1 Tax=unclassified Sphingomonas TaxID=196159 RepID=UPI0006FDCBB9|nr:MULTISPECIES: hypothetical protein [unclassified Sphingomonas]KQN07252.1 hypothetical protein ASE78_13655 [Sphingomonas sp. Leaf25]
MRAILAILGLVALIGAGLMALGFISIDQTRTAALPSVKVEGGQAPKFDVDVSKVEVGTVNRTVEVPAISVEKPANAN